MRMRNVRITLAPVVLVVGMLSCAGCHSGIEAEDRTGIKNVPQGGLTGPLPMPPANKALEMSRMREMQMAHGHQRPDTVRGPIPTPPPIGAAAGR